MKPSLLSIPYLVLLLLFVQGMHHATSPLALPWRVLAQLTLSNAAAIAAIVVGAIPTIPAAYSGHLALDIAMLVESLALLGFALYLYLSTRHGPPAFRMALVRAPSPPIVAVISLLLLVIVALLQPCVASLVILAVAMSLMACWASGMLRKRMIRVYKRIDPFVRLFVACWIAAEHTHLVLLNLARAAHLSEQALGYNATGHMWSQVHGANAQSVRQPDPATPYFTAVESTDPDSLWLPPAFNPWLWCLGDAAAPIAWIQDVFLYAVLVWMGYFRPTTREEVAETRRLSSVAMADPHGKKRCQSYSPNEGRLNERRTVDTRKSHRWRAAGSRYVRRSQDPTQAQALCSEEASRGGGGRGQRGRHASSFWGVSALVSPPVQAAGSNGTQQAITRRKLGFYLRLAWQTAFAGAILLIAWPLLAPCATTTLLLLVGASALLQSPRWRFAVKAVDPELQRRHRDRTVALASNSLQGSGTADHPSARGTLGGGMSSCVAAAPDAALPTTRPSSADAPSSSSSSAPPPAKAAATLLDDDEQYYKHVGTLITGNVRGTFWLPATFGLALLWVCGQYCMVLLCQLLTPVQAAGTSFSLTARVGLSCNQPLPGFGVSVQAALVEWAGFIELRISLAFLVQLAMCTALGLCCRVHMKAVGRLRTLCVEIALEDCLPSEPALPVDAPLREPSLCLPMPMAPVREESSRLSLISEQSRESLLADHLDGGLGGEGRVSRASRAEDTPTPDASVAGEDEDEDEWRAVDSTPDQSAPKAEKEGQLVAVAPAAAPAAEPAVVPAAAPAAPAAGPAAAPAAAQPPPVTAPRLSAALDTPLPPSPVAPRLSAALDTPLPPSPALSGLVRPSMGRPSMAAGGLDRLDFVMGGGLDRLDVGQSSIASDSSRPGSVVQARPFEQLPPLAKLASLVEQSTMLNEKYRTLLADRRMSDALKAPTRLARFMHAVYSRVRAYLWVIFEIWLTYVRTTTTLCLTLLAGVSKCSLLRFGWVVVFLLAHTDTMQGSKHEATRKAWYAIAATYAALSAAATTTWMSFNPTIPAEGSEGGVQRGLDDWPGFVGLHSGANTVTLQGLELGWRDEAWPLLLLLCFTLERSNVGWRVDARRRWGLVRDHLLPKLTKRQTTRTRRRRLWALWRKFTVKYRGNHTAQVWLSYFALLLVGLISPVNAIGATCLAFLIALLFFEQSYTELSERASMQLPLWRALEVLLVATLGVRYAFRIPFVAKFFLQPGGLLGPNCDADYGANAVDYPRTLTVCTAFLQDIGLAGGDAVIQLGASALLIALCANRIRACRRDSLVERDEATSDNPRSSFLSPSALMRRNKRQSKRDRQAKRSRLLLYALVQLEQLATVAVLAAGFTHALTPPASALRFLYLVISLVGCFGRLTKFVWLPLGEISAISLLLQYCFQSLLVRAFFPVVGCDGPTPSPACDVQWAGLQPAEAGSELFLTLFRNVPVLLLTLIQRQLQLRIRMQTADDRILDADGRPSKVEEVTDLGSPDTVKRIRRLQTKAKSAFRFVSGMMSLAKHDRFVAVTKTPGKEAKKDDEEEDAQHDNGEHDDEEVEAEAAQHMRAGANRDALRRARQALGRDTMGGVTLPQGTPPRDLLLRADTSGIAVDLPSPRVSPTLRRESSGGIPVDLDEAESSMAPLRQPSQPRLEYMESTLSQMDDLTEESEPPTTASGEAGRAVGAEAIKVSVLEVISGGGERTRVGGDERTSVGGDEPAGTIWVPSSQVVVSAREGLNEPPLARLAAAALDAGESCESMASRCTRCRWSDQTGDGRGSLESVLSVESRWTDQGRSSSNVDDVRWTAEEETPEAVGGEGEPVAQPLGLDRIAVDLDVAQPARQKTQKVQKAATMRSRSRRARPTAESAKKTPERRRLKRIAAAVKSIERRFVGDVTRVLRAAVMAMVEPLALTALLASALLRLNVWTLGYVAFVGWERFLHISPRMVHRLACCMACCCYRLPCIGARRREVHGVRHRGAVHEARKSWLMTIGFRVASTTDPKEAAAAKRAKRWARGGGAPRNERATGIRHAEWVGICVWLVISIGMQYMATLSPLPPTVWPAPDRRPWTDWGMSWEYAEGTCARTGSLINNTRPEPTSRVLYNGTLIGNLTFSNVTFLSLRNMSTDGSTSFGDYLSGLGGAISSSLMRPPPSAAPPPGPSAETLQPLTSGLMCYAGLDGGVPLAWLAMDVITLMLCALTAYSGLGGAGREQRAQAAMAAEAEADDYDGHGPRVAIDDLANKTVLGKALNSLTPETSWFSGDESGRVGFDGVSGRSDASSSRSGTPGNVERDAKRNYMFVHDFAMNCADAFLRCSHLIILIITICIGTTTSVGASNITGLLQVFLGLLAARVLCDERALVLESGRRWQLLHFFSFLSLALLVIFQAPLLPAECSDYEEPDYKSTDSDRGSQWCSLVAVSLGFSKLHVAVDPTARADQHASKTFPLIFVWLLLDVQMLIFRHPCFSTRVVRRYRSIENTARAVKLHNDAREEQLKLLHIAKLAAWNQMRTLWLNRIEKRIHQIEKLLRADRLAHGGTASPSVGRRQPPPPGKGAAGKGVGDRAGVATAADGSPSPPLERPLDARRLLLEGKPQTARPGVTFAPGATPETASLRRSDDEESDDDDDEPESPVRSDRFSLMSRGTPSSSDVEEYLKMQDSTRARIRRIRHTDSMTSAVDELQAVVGGSKAACEAALLMCGAGSKDLEWLGARGSHQSQALMLLIESQFGFRPPLELSEEELDVEQPKGKTKKSDATWAKSSLTTSPNFADQGATGGHGGKGRRGSAAPFGGDGGGGAGCTPTRRAPKGGRRFSALPFALMRTAGFKTDGPAAPLVDADADPSSSEGAEVRKTAWTHLSGWISRSRPSAPAPAADDTSAVTRRLPARCPPALIDESIKEGDEAAADDSANAPAAAAAAAATTEPTLPPLGGLSDGASKPLPSGSAEGGGGGGGDYPTASQAARLDRDGRMLSGQSTKASGEGKCMRLCSWLCTALSKAFREWLHSLRDPVLYTVRADRILQQDEHIEEAKDMLHRGSVAHKDEAHMDGSGRFAPPLHSESTESLVDMPTTPRGGCAPAARVSTAQRWKMAKSNRSHAKSHGSMRLSSNIDKTRWHDVKEEVGSRRSSGHHRALRLPRSAPHRYYCTSSPPLRSSPLPLRPLQSTCIARSSHPVSPPPF